MIEIVCTYNTLYLSAEAPWSACEKQKKRHFFWKIVFLWWKEIEWKILLVEKNNKCDANSIGCVEYKYQDPPMFYNACFLGEGIELIVDDTICINNEFDSKHGRENIIPYHTISPQNPETKVTPRKS